VEKVINGNIMIDEVITQGIKLIKDSFNDNGEKRSSKHWMVILVFLILGIIIFLIWDYWIGGIVSLFFLLFIVFVIIPRLSKQKNST